MKIKPKIYAESLLELCKGKSTAQIDTCVKEFLSLLAHRGISRMGQSILDSMKDSVARQTGSSRIVVTCAHDLSESEQELFEKMLHESYGKKSTIAFSSDPQLISGFRIKVNDSVVDASASGQLNSLRDYLKQSAVRC